MIKLLIIILLFFFIFNNIKNVENFDNTVIIGKVYVVNLDKDSDRLENIKNQCKKENIKFNRFSAVNGNLLNIDTLVKNNKLRLYKNSFNHNKNGRSSLKGSIGCALTHKKIWEKVAKSDKNTLVFEDDIILPNNFWDKLNKNIKDVPNNWDIIYLGGVRIYGSRISKNIVKAISTKNNYWNNCGTYSYIINPSSANKLLNIINPISNYLDIQMNRQYSNLNVYYIVPNIVKHNFKIPSTRNKGKGDGYVYSKYFVENSKKITIV